MQQAYPIVFGTNGTERARIDSSGNVGIGSNAPAAPLGFGATTGQKIDFYGNNGFGFGVETYEFRIATDTNSAITFKRGGYSGSESGRFDSSGRFLVGTSTARSNVDYQFGFDTPRQQLELANGGLGFSIIQNYDNGTAATPAYLTLARAGSTAIGSTTIVANNNWLGEIDFAGSDGTDFTRAASIRCEVDGTPGANDMPGRLVFSTTADGASSPTERMRIRSDGGLVYGTGAAPGSDISSGTGFWFSTSTGLFYIRSVSSPVAAFNRGTDDGALVEFKQDQTTEGTISVSGTTVSYNGAHLSRWSQLPSGAERIEILRGSVLSNIDEMCEWGKEDNEQLNRMKVSDVEGDKNVSGVFQAWDDDDDTYTNDFYCAMTGDFIIRIAEGVTVERGDLLMSAGDGTAKPQDDDIIRSKTIAKVTSTNVSCTYEDGSYCVPCVLMAC
jgi:hypothetical protein